MATAPNTAADTHNRNGATRDPGRFAFALLLTLLFVTDAFAHKPDQSYVFLSIHDAKVDGRVEVTLPELNAALGLDFPAEGDAVESDVAARALTLQEYLGARVAFRVNGEAVPLTWTGHELLTIKAAQYAVLTFRLDGFEGAPAAIDVRYDALFDAMPRHRGLLVVENDWKTGTFDNEAVVALVFGPGETEQTLDLSSSSVMGGILAMVGLGTHHIWIGIDHVLFLLALLLPSCLARVDGRWVPVARFRHALLNVVAVVTLFTVAHTITLSLAALGTVTLPSRFVESVIAASIAIAALDILRPVFHSWLWTIVFAFGLFHGFGFASVLGEIGIPPGYLVHSLLGFNIGVELGQLAIVCALFPLLYLVRNVDAYARWAIQSGATALIVVSLYWFVERAFEIDLPAGAIVNRVVGMARGAFG